MLNEDTEELPYLSLEEQVSKLTDPEKFELLCKLQADLMKIERLPF